jgi:FtsP/CotA-like multicopper oxidase with cupredoxin domain
MSFADRISRAFLIIFGVTFALASGGSMQAAGGTPTGVGLNLAALGSGGDVTFVDAMKEAAPWTSAGRLKLDSLGNVVALAAGQFADTVIYPRGAYPAGSYTLLYDGTGSFAIARASGTMVSRAPGRITIAVTPKPGYGIHLRLIATDARNYARNIRLLLPGFSMSYGVAPFAPTFLDALHGVAAIRFAAWEHPEPLQGRSWAARTVPGSFTQAGPAGVAPEYMVALANAAEVSPWFTLPVDANDDYVARFAMLVARGLDPRLHPIFEYGNEIWQPGTAANGYAQVAGRRLGLGPTPSSAALAWYSLRSVQVFALLDRAFSGSLQRPSHILSVPLGRLGTADASEARAILGYANAGERADALAVSADVKNRTAVGDALGATSLQAALGSTAALADRAHLQVVAYQGGDGGQLTPTLLATWRAFGGGLFIADPLTAASPPNAASALLAAAAYSRLTLAAVASAARQTAAGPALGVADTSTSVPGATLLAERFAGSVTPSRAWLTAGDSCLTAGTATTAVLSIHACNGSAPHDAPGRGALQLTRDAKNQRGFAVYRTPFETSRGLEITLTDYAFEGAATPGNGLTIFLTDAAALMPTAPATANAVPASTYLSISFGAGAGYAPSSGNLRSIVVRGAASAGYPALGGPADAQGRSADLPFALDAPAAGSRPAQAPALRVTLTPNGGLTIAIDRHDGNGYTVYYHQQIAGRIGQPSLPGSLFLGFSASTGAGPVRQQIAGLRVATITPATSFGPGQLHNLVAWYDASNLPTVIRNASGGVTAWKDSTGYADTLSVPATHSLPAFVASGISGLGSINFDGTTLLAGSNQAFSANLFNESTVFIVGDETPTTETGDILFSGAYHATSPTWTLRPTSFGDSYFAFNTETAPLEAPKVVSGATIWAAGGSVSNAARLLRRDGSTIANAAGPGIVAKGSYPLAVGEMYSGGTAASYGYRGQIGEIVIYNRYLTPAETEEIEGYLACKWGLQSSLPASHPYRVACPTGSNSVPTPTPVPSPTGTALPDPPELSSSGGSLTVNITAVQDPVTHDPAFSYNGAEIPPTLKLLPGDTLYVNLTNNLPVPPAGSTYANDVNLHYHGLHVSPNAPADDSIDMVAAPGQSLQYKIAIPTNHPPGLYWYHSHAHGEADRQNLAGMSGALVIEGISKYVPAVTNLGTRILIVRDAQPPGTPLPPGDLSQLSAMRWGMQRTAAARTRSVSGMQMTGLNQANDLRGATTAQTRNPYVDTDPFYRNFVRPNAADTHCQGAETPNKVWTINGVSQPSIGLEPGEQQFWRLVNAASDTYLDVQLDNSTMQIVSLDGVPLAIGDGTPASLTVTHYVVPPSSRIEFIVTGPPAGTQAYLRTNCFDAGPTGLAMPAAILASINPNQGLTSTGPERTSPHASESTFHSAAYIKAHAASATQTVYFSEQLQINGQSYNPAGPPMFYAQVGTTQDWTIVNTSTQVHTFHMHQIHFILQAINGVTQAQQYEMDNVNVPAATSSGPGTVQIRLDFTDPLIVGTFLLHCHILSHEDSGMMAKIRVGTAPPLSVGASTLTFSSPAAPKQTVAITGGQAPYSPSGCTGVANASITGSTLTVTPVGAGDCLLTVEDATGLTATVSVDVTPVASPVTLSTPSASFTSPTAAAQSIGISGGTPPYTAAGCTGTAKDTISGSTLTVTPEAAGTCTLVVSDAKNETASLSVVVSAATTNGYATDSLTFHHDSLRTGWDQTETSLTTTNVASSDFALLTSLTAPAGDPAFGKVYAQPLYVTNEATSDGKTHNLVIVATATDQVYAFDDKTFQVVWHRSFLNPPSVVAQSWTDTACYSPGPDVGITGTPVIDRTLNRIYAVVATKENGTFHQRIHAISLASGLEAVNSTGQQVGPTDITGTVTMATGGTASVDPLWNLQRPALLESAGNIYVALGSKCDFDGATVHGWMLAYSASSLAMTGNLFDLADYNNGSGLFLGSVWMSGYGPAADPQGNVYFATGNGPFDGVNGFGMSVVKVAGTLSHAAGNVSTFTPYAEANDSKSDNDLGSGGVLLMPDQKGTYPHIVVAGGKCGAGAANGGTVGCQKYLLNRDKLGGRQANEAGSLWHGNTAGWMWGGPAYFQDAAGVSHIVYGGGGGGAGWDPLSTYNVNLSPVSLSVQSSQVAVGCLICSRGDPGGSLPFVSSNGTTAGTAIVWTIKTPPQSGGNMALYAFNALSMKGTLFSGVAGPWTVPSGATQIPGPFVSPLIASGKVYVPADGSVAVFGLKSQNTAIARTRRAAALRPIEAAASEAQPATAAALQALGEHAVYGTIVQVDGDVLTVALRDGRQLRVDAEAAVRSGRYSAPLFAGKIVVISGSYGADGTLEAAVISKLGRADASAPPDR